MGTLPLQFGLLEGEIISIQERPKDLSFDLYVVKVYLPDGNQSILRNCVSATGSFGGVFDYLQVVHRTSTETGGQAEYKTGTAALQTIGERVLVGLLNGDIRRPVIITSLPHPMAARDLPDNESQKPQLNFQFQGVKAEINDKGEFLLTHLGPPEVKEGGSDPGQKKENLLLFKIAEDGSWNFLDSEKQTIKFEAKAKKITISNGDDNIILDKGSNKLTIEVKGEVSIKSEKDCTVDAKGSVNVKSEKDAKVTAKGSIEMDANGAKVVLKSGKVAIGSSVIELVDAFVQLLGEMKKAAPKLCTTPAGPGILDPGVLAKIIEIETKLNQIKGSV